MDSILPRRFFQRSALEVAPDLLGKLLVRKFPDGRRLVGKIVEVEAYDGPEDLACHSSHGRTKRTEVMFGPAGHAYVYLIYGMYHCLNIVVGKLGAAVLIRAVEPIFVGAIGKGTDPNLQGSVPSEGSEGRVASGPGKLCRWLGIDRDFNGWDLTQGERLWVEKGRGEKLVVVKSPRIGVAYAGAWARKPWRFYIKDNRSVSTPFLHPSGVGNLIGPLRDLIGGCSKKKTPRAKIA